MFIKLQNSLALWLMNLDLRETRFEKEEGQTLAEYAMILGLIAVVVIGVVVTLGSTISSLFSTVAANI